MGIMAAHSTNDPFTDPLYHLPFAICHLPSALAVPSVHPERDASQIRRTVRGEKHHGIRKLVRSSHSQKRNAADEPFSNVVGGGAFPRRGRVCQLDHTVRRGVAGGNAVNENSIGRELQRERLRQIGHGRADRIREKEVAA